MGVDMGQCYADVETTGSCVICAAEMSKFRLFMDICRDCQERRVTQGRLMAAMTWVMVGMSVGFVIAFFVL